MTQRLRISCTLTGELYFRTGCCEASLEIPLGRGERIEWVFIVCHTRSGGRTSSTSRLGGDIRPIALAGDR